MDANKLKKLEDIDYTIEPCCGLCEAAVFSNDNTDWGVCVRHYYKHQKHTEEPRMLSINRYGSCSSFSIKEQKQSSMKHFEKFIKGV